MTTEATTPEDKSASPTNAFAVPNYRRFFIGNSISNSGTWFQTLAQALLVVKLTHRASSLGEVFALQSLPMLFFGPFIGPFIDRANLRKVLVTISALAGIEAFLLAGLVESHRVTITWIYGLCVAVGFIQIFLQPTVRTMVSELVPTSALPSGVSYNSVQQSVGRLAGPAAAGLVYAWRGPVTCFVVNGISYIVVLAVVFSLRRDQLYPRPKVLRSPRQLLETIDFVWHSPIHRGQLLSSLVIGIFAFNFPLVWASMTQFVLHSGSASFGIVESINAAFASLGGVLLARRLHHPTRRTYAFGALWFGASLGISALAPNIGFLYFDMAIFGLGNVAYSTINQTVLQMNTPRERVGSVMTLLSYCQQGTTPIGSLIVAWLSSLASVRAAIGLGAVAAIGSAFVLGFSKAGPGSRDDPVANEGLTVH